MITPYLSMSLPDPNITTGPQYAQQINNAFLVVDAQIGTGVTPSELNLNGDVDFQSNDAINLRSVRFVNTGALAAPTDVGCAYDFSGNLWFNDNAGNQIQLTNNGSVNAGNGNISGMTGTSASVSFNTLTNAYTFNATPTKQAGINALSGVFSYLYVSGTVYAPNLTVGTASFGNVQNLSASTIQTTQLTASSAILTVATIPTLTTTTENVTQLTASGGKITTLTSTTSTIGTSTVTTENVTTLTASNASIPTLNSTNATIGTLTVTGTPSFSNLTITGNEQVQGTLAITGNLNPLANINLPTTASLAIPAAQQSMTFYIAPVIYPGSGTPAASPLNGCPQVPAGNPFYFPLRLPRAGTITQLQCNINNSTTQGSPTSFQFRRMSQTGDPGSTSATTIALISSGSSGLCNFLMSGLNETFKDTDPYWYYVGITAGSSGQITIGALAVTVTVPVLEAGIRG